MKGNPRITMPQIQQTCSLSNPFSGRSLGQESKCWRGGEGDGWRIQTQQISPLIFNKGFLLSHINQNNSGDHWVPTSTASEDVNPGPTAVVDHWEDLALELMSGLFLSQNHPQIFRPEGTSPVALCVTHIVHDLINPNAESGIY